MPAARPPAALLGLAAILALAGCIGPSGALPGAAPLTTAKSVDLGRYAGTWYEIARYEQSFQRGCEGVTAQYTPKPDGTIGVLNTCRDGAPDGPARSAEGTARVVPGTDGAKLKVSFFGPFEGDYWVIDRAPDYAWAIVGDPSRRTLWFLSRTPTVSAARFAALEARATAAGYDTSRLRRTAQ